MSDPNPLPDVGPQDPDATEPPDPYEGEPVEEEDSTPPFDGDESGIINVEGE